MEQGGGQDPGIRSNGAFRPRVRRLTVLAGPTAVGKGTVSADIRERYPEVWLSVSVTTRPMRPGEVPGKHYHYVDEATFDAMIAAGELLEYVGPLVETHVQEKPLSVALREINAGLLVAEPTEG